MRTLRGFRDCVFGLLKCDVTTVDFAKFVFEPNLDGLHVVQYVQLRIVLLLQDVQGPLDFHRFVVRLRSLVAILPESCDCLFCGCMLDLRVPSYTVRRSR